MALATSSQDVIQQFMRAHELEMLALQNPLSQLPPNIPQFPHASLTMTKGPDSRLPFSMLSRWRSSALFGKECFVPGHQYTIILTAKKSLDSSN